MNEASQPHPLFQNSQTVPLEQLRIAITYNNIAFDKRLDTDWGFGCLIEGLDQTILFDTGRGAGLFMSNLKQLDIDPQSVARVFISHEHQDHTGGLFRFLEKRNDLVVVVPRAFSSAFRKIVRKAGADIVRVDDPVQITAHAFSTGQMRSMIAPEHALLILTDRGVIVITGCAHPGIVNIVRRVKSLTGRDILLVMGGFHLMHEDERSARSIVTEFKALGVQHVAPSHCTGTEAMQAFKDVYQNRYIDSGVGKVITADDFQT